MNCCIICDMLVIILFKKLFVTISEQSVNVWCVAFSVAQLRAPATTFDSKIHNLAHMPCSRIDVVLSMKRYERFEDNNTFSSAKFFIIFYETHAEHSNLLSVWPRICR